MESNLSWTATDEGGPPGSLPVSVYTGAFDSEDFSRRRILKQGFYDNGQKQNTNKFAASQRESGQEEDQPI